MEENGMAQSNQLDHLYKTTSIQVPKHAERDFSDGEASSSGVSSGLTTFSSTPDQQSSTINSGGPAAQFLFEETMSSLKNKPFMKVSKSPHKFTEVALRLYKEHEDIRNQWKATLHYYRNNLKCNDDNRIQFELGECIGAIMNDGRKIMIGLDSVDDLVKNILITCMRICIEPDFKLEIRVGFGGTTDPLNVRAPAYPVAGTTLLNRLLELRQNISSGQESLSGIVPTPILHNTPLLIFYSAHTAAVQVNNFDENIATKNAIGILSYIQRYIDTCHPDLTEYVRYVMDHSNTYQPELLNRIKDSFISNCHDQALLDALNTHAKAHGSDTEGSIKYASKHSIGYRDIIDKKNLQPLFHPLHENETNVQVNQEMDLPDCTISIAGSVEQHFGEVRKIIQQSCKNDSQMNNQDQYHFPLLIRMLSEAGHIPVYYRHSKDGILLDIPLDDVLNGKVTDLYENKKMSKPIKEDLLIITDDIGISILEPIWGPILMIKSYDISSWKKIVTTLIDLCLECWKEHAKNANRTCQCSTETTEGITQFFEHYNILNYYDHDGCQIISCIINALEKENRTDFGKFKLPPLRVLSIRASTETTDNINHELHTILGKIFIQFILNEFRGNNSQEQVNDGTST